MGKTTSPAAHGQHRHQNQRRREPQGEGNRAHCRPPPVQRRHATAAPEPLVVPEPLSAVNGRKEGADHADAAAGDDVDLDAGFVERAQHAGMVGAGRTSAAQHQRGPAVRGVDARRLASDRAWSFAGVVVDRDEPDDLELAGAAGRDDLDRVTRFLVQQAPGRSARSSKSAPLRHRRPRASPAETPASRPCSRRRAAWSRSPPGRRECDRR